MAKFLYNGNSNSLLASLLEDKSSQCGINTDDSIKVKETFTLHRMQSSFGTFKVKRDLRQKLTSLPFTNQVNLTGGFD